MAIKINIYDPQTGKYLESFHLAQYRTVARYWGALFCWLHTLFSLSDLILFNTFTYVLAKYILLVMYYKYHK